MPGIATAFLRLVRPLDYRRVDECRRVLEWLDPRVGDYILDLGCGDGYYDRRMALAGATIVAVDGNPARVALAQRRNPHPHVSYQHIRAEELDFPPGTFTKAVSICVLEHIPDDLGTLRRIAAGLQTGGRLVLSCDSLSNSAATDALRARHAKRYAVRHFYTRDSLADLLARAGLKLLKTDFVLTTPVSFAIARVTYLLDDVGRLPLGWAVKYPGLAVASSAGLAASRLSERLKHRDTEGLTLIAEAVRV